jgi:hypothetical protein
LASRTPTVTATSATEIVASSSSAAELMKASRSVFIVASRCRWLAKEIESTWTSARPYDTRVGRPRITSRKWPDNADSERHRRWVDSWVVRPIRAAKTGSNGTVKATIKALGQSMKARVPMASSGRNAPETSAGR